MDQVVQGIITAGVGILIVAAIYQLNKKGTPLVPAVGTAYKTTLTNLFKG